jgi:DNA (cytosine-5)-methyltransferase 1
MEYICKKCGKEFAEKSQCENHNKVEPQCNKSLEEHLEDLDLNDKKLKFIDLCYGICGYHYALQNLGHECVMSSDINEECRMQPVVDFTKIDIKSIPYFDILCAGFSCQPFSKAGYQKGFDDERDNIFFDICKIIKYHKPKYIILENVRNLSTHYQGNMWNVIRSKIDELNYCTYDKPVILNALYFGVSPSRERVVIMCKRKDLGILPILPSITRNNI